MRFYSDELDYIPYKRNKPKISEEKLVLINRMKFKTRELAKKAFSENWDSNKIKNENYKLKLKFRNNFVFPTKQQIRDIIKNYDYKEELPPAPFKYQVKPIEIDLKNGLEIIHYLVNQDFRNYFGFNYELNRSFDCPLIAGNKAWIAKDTNGHMWYFTQNKSNYFCLDIINITRIVFNLNNKEAINRLIKDFKLKIVCQWKLEQSNKYLQNIDFINSDWYYFSPELSIYIQKYQIILNELFVIGQKCIGTKEASYLNESVFFCSVRYLEKRLNLKRSTISTAISLFALLGFISKVPKEFIPTQYLKRANKESEVKNQKNLIGFYAVHLISDKLISNAEKIVTILKENNFKPYNINKNNIENIFGKETSEKIFPKQNDNYR